MPDPIHPFKMTAITSDQIADAALIKRLMVDVGPATLGAAPTDSLSATPAQLVQMASKSDIGLGNVDNTSDANKPISSATQSALDLKASTSSLSSHTGNTSNPHSVTKTQVGLGNVDNTSDANKPVSSATQLALNAKENTQTPATSYEAVSGVVTEVRSWSPQTIRQSSAATNIIGSGGRAFYFDLTDEADVGGYGTLLPNPSTNVQSGVTQSNTGTDFNLAAAFITNTDEPQVQVIPSGMCDLVIYATTGNDRSNPVAKIKVELYKRALNATETLLNTYTSQDFSYTSLTPLTWSSTDTDSHFLALTDRLLVKVYTARVSGPATVDVTLSFEGDTPSRIHSTIKESNKALTALALPGLPSAANKMLVSSAGGVWGLIDYSNTPIGINYSAWVESDGNDSTAAIGNPAKPYATMQAAFDDGARMFYLGYGTFSGIQLSNGSIDISILGQGASRTTISVILSVAQGDIIVRDIGVFSVNISIIGVDASTADTGAGSGSSSGAIYLYGVYAATIRGNAGNGGASDGNNNSGTGGNAGNITLTNCIVATINSNGGSGGYSEVTGSAAGNGGTVRLIRSSVTSSISVNGGTGGSSGDMNSTGGNGGHGGLVDLIHSDAVYIYGNSGAGGSGPNGNGTSGIAASFSGRHSSVTTALSLDPNSGSEGSISGSHLFVVSTVGAPTITAVVSHISGTPY